MQILIDTNILLRSSQPVSSDHAVALNAQAAVLASGRAPCVSSQAIYEFMAVATRFVAENGLGLSHAAADVALSHLLIDIEVLYDSDVAAAETRRLIVLHKVTGKKVHDARLAAIMNVHGIKEILTFNDKDFARYSEIVALNPRDVTPANLAD
ncbi:MAG: type II toxin-antitoxin system VapC family toxin [Phycisphaerales bacterium]|nr:type II toxin-antitoxin system VapC family toxin [Phycisphaerales bacterium]